MGEYIIATWEGDQFVISNGSRMLTGVVDEQGIVCGQVLYCGIQDGGFVMYPNQEATWSLVSESLVWDGSCQDWPVETFEGYQEFQHGVYWPNSDCMLFVQAPQDEF